MSTTGYLGFLLPGLAAFSAVASAAILLTGWNRRGGALARQADPRSTGQPGRFELGRTPFASGLLDVTAEIRTVLGHLTPLAAQRFVQLEVAVQPELAVRADSRILREVVGDLVSNAIRRAPCGRVLVSAVRHGGRVQIAVTDDGAGPVEGTQEAALRDTERLVALQGGTIHVEANRPGEGSTMVVRLPEPAATTRGAAPAPSGGAVGAPSATALGPTVGSAATSMAWNR